MSTRTKIGTILTVFFFIAFAALHLKLVSDTFYVDPAGNFHANAQGGYADLPMHMTLISKFAYSPTLDLNQSIYYGSKIRYHFYLDMVRGWLLKLTHSWPISVLWPVYILVIANIVLIYLIYQKFLKNKGLTILSFIVFFFGAGTSGWGVLRGQPLAPLLNFGAQYPAQDSIFGPTLTMSFTFQQAFLLGLFLFLAFFWFLCALRNSSGSRTRWYVLGAGISLGLLPLSHAHTFVAACVLIAILFVFNVSKAHRPYCQRIFSAGIVGAVLALPQIYYILILGSNSAVQNHDTFSRFRLGWMVQAGLGSIQFPTDSRSAFSIPFLSFLWTNFGIILPVLVLCAVSLYIVRKNISDEMRHDLSFLLATSAALFILVQTVNFQPWDLDNARILVYFLFFAAPFIVAMLAYLFKFSRVVQIVVLVVAVFFMTLSGIVDVTYQFIVPKSDLPLIFSTDAQKMADYIRSNVAPNDLVLTGTTHLNPVSSLAGRPTLVGYPGWLWSQSNIDYGARLQQLEDFFRAPSLNATILREYPIRYVLLDPTVEADYKVTPSALDLIFKREFQTGVYILYRTGPEHKERL